MCLDHAAAKSLNLSLGHGDDAVATSSRPAESPQTILACIAKAAVDWLRRAVVFASGLSAKSFEDEYAYITQSYYAELFCNGELQPKLVAGGFRIDLQPLPKYLIGMSLRSAELPMPSPVDASAVVPDDYKPFGDHATLIAARLPTLGLGVLGCVAIFGCGLLIKSGRVGLARGGLADVQSALPAARSPSDVRRSLRGVHADVARALRLCGRASGRGGSASWHLLFRGLAGLLGRLVAALQAQRLSGADDHRGLDRDRLAAAGLSSARKMALSRRRS